MSRSLPVCAASVGALALLAGCGGGGAPAQSDGSIAVNASDSACEVTKQDAPAGKITFQVANKGSKVTEFYLLGVGDRIMGEVENIGPGLTRRLIVEVPDGGTYTTACKPGMVGDGIRAPFTVTGQATRSVDDNARLAEATAGYKRYVTSQIEALVPKTEEFVNTVKAGNVDAAKAQFPIARTYWERIEPVAESFGDLDPKMDGREDDEREPGVGFTGYHRLEKDLWVDGLKADSGAIADQLLADMKDLQNRVATIELTPVQLANGAKELLDEVATGKITGEEDRYSHTDLWDFKANVEGSQAAIAALRPVIDERDKNLGPTLDQRFADVEKLLEGYRDGDGFKLYTQLTPEDTKKMSTAVDALGEPVSQVAAVVTK
ncbi:iron uptake system protein EfeO [Pseudonocardia spinosispora]|uniref:iron uptake system protein EfeO n=1 Tax=Pseudonocardia spinosispora TaxID=103441 RepID=UPI0004195289|nr:iron uptake system protein EfeO [Pseudonocardia spinosispora]